MRLKLPIVTDLPPTPTELHSAPCKQCPSTGDISEDYEMQEILESSKAVRQAHAFRCAWRPEKLCRGYCDVMGLTQEDFPEVQRDYVAGGMDYYDFPTRGCDE